MTLSRRNLLEMGTASGAALLLPEYGQAAPTRGGRLIVSIVSEPSLLTSALTTAGPTQYVSSKIFDGLVTYDANFKPQPQLAESWTISPDGLTIAFKLRPGVLWHDGKPFTSADVAYSVLQVWKKYHSRGRSTFANVVAVDTPDPLTAIWRLSKPAPYIFNALNSAESQIVPRHLYENRDVLTNPHNIAPVGTGPFRFVEWKRGNYIALERNPHYWRPSRPYLDKIVFRVMPDAASSVTALETGDVQLLTQPPISDLSRLGRTPGIKVNPRPNTITAALAVFEFNLDRPQFKDVRVRRAFAHAIDREFIRKTIYQGFGSVATSTLPQDVPAFQADGLPAYPFDLDKAAWLLDQAGFRPGADGTRMTITHDPNFSDVLFQTAQYLRVTLGKIGIRLQIRRRDFAAFVRQAYTAHDFDTLQYAATSGPDPAIGTQRFYWSHSIQAGAAFSNGSHYVNPEVDRLLEAAQAEINPSRRKSLYADFQRKVQTDLPRIPLVFVEQRTVSSTRLRDFLGGAYGMLDNFADANLTAA